MEEFAPEAGRVEPVPLATLTLLDRCCMAGVVKGLNGLAC